MTNREASIGKLKVFVPCFLLNAVLFITSVFMHEYTRHIQHWSYDAWFCMSFCWGVAKMVLSGCVIISVVGYYRSDEDRRHYL